MLALLLVALLLDLLEDVSHVRCLALELLELHLILVILVLILHKVAVVLPHVSSLILSVHLATIHHSLVSIHPMLLHLQLDVLVSLSPLTLALIVQLLSTGGQEL